MTPSAGTDEAAAACPSCGGGAETFVADPRDREYFAVRPVRARIMRCRACAGLFQTPWPAAGELDALYTPDYQTYPAARFPLLARLFEFQQRAAARAFVTRHGRACSVLDFGRGDGLFARLLLDRGVRDVAGFDFAARRTAQPSPFPFFTDPAMIAAGNRRFDIIRMNHVIEHLVDLDGTMRRLRSLLSPGGRILGQTPNAAHVTADLFGRHWGPLHFPYHTVVFSPSGLAAAARRWGLRLDRSGPGLLTTGWAMSVENMLKAATGSRRRGRTPVYGLAVLAALPAALVDRVRGDAAVFDFELVPEEA